MALSRDMMSRQRGLKTCEENTSRLLKNAHLRRSPHPSSLRRTGKYASLLWISGALDLDVFEQPVSRDFFRNRLVMGRPSFPIQAFQKRSSRPLLPQTVKPST
jgi:hypothetical protein